MKQYELLAATTALEASTTAIRQQEEVLKKQRAYLESVRSQQTADDGISRARRLEAQNLTLAVEESWQTLGSQLEELEQGVQVQVNGLATTVTQYLHHDDRCLQDLAAMLVLDGGDGTALRAYVTKLTEKLSDLNREEIECRLNRIYLQQLAGKEDPQRLEHGELEVELEQDLRSLHREVADVAAMTTSQEFTVPLLQAIAEQQNRKNDRVRAVLEDISGSMTGLTEAAENCASRLRAVHSFHTAISAYREDFDGLARRPVRQLDAGGQGEKAQRYAVTRSMSNALHHWNVCTSEDGSVEQALRNRKQRLEQDARRSRCASQDVLRRHRNALPEGIEGCLESDSSADRQIAELEQNMHKVSEAMEGIDLARILPDEGGPQSRFVARWAGKG